MSNYIEYNDKIAFHPGYYLKEIIDESGLTQEDFAKRLGTTPKNLSILVRGDQSLSIDIATKLSRMLGTTIAYWLNLQQAYDEKAAEFLSEEELKKEREVFKLIDYKYFRDNFGMPDLSRKVDEQIKYVREFLSVSSLTVLEGRNLAVSFRSYAEELSRSNIVNANAMVQIAINRALKVETPKYNKKKFEKAVDFALTQTKNHDGFLTEVKKAFEKAGVVIVVLPNLKSSGINGATKKVDGNDNGQ
jgi:addiction module HigA family antidote